jgi:hypothetical protein
MLVNVGNLEANPYRKIDKYPIRREKVEQLKASIGETGFWDNILARPKPEHTKVLTRMVFNDDTGEEEYDPYGDGPEILIGPPADETTDESDIVEAFIPGIYGDSVSDDNYYQQPIIQIAYGHHRLAAIRELGIEEVDIPVKDIDDRTMIKIMANENMEDWETNTAVINETVLTVMEFITSMHIDEHEPLMHKRVGKFLGTGWAIRTIQQALASVRDEKVSREAAEIFETPGHSERFRYTLNSPVYDGLIPKEEQKAFAEEVKKEALADTSSKGELTGDKIVNAVHSVIKKKAGTSTQISTKVIQDAAFKEERNLWYKALHALMEIQTRDFYSSKLSDERRMEIEEDFVQRIEILTEEWRNG